MQKVICIVVKNGTKYQIGIEKSVSEIINEINACKDNFYKIVDSCAIHIDEIVSVEQFEYDPNKEEEAGSD